MFGRPPDQYGFVVEDLRGAVSWHRAVFGLGPWSIYHYNAETLPSRRFRGGPGDFVTHSAVTANAAFSVVQPISGRSTYAELLARRGPGLHHIAYRVESMATCREQLAAAGIEEIMTGSGHGVDGDGVFAFFDTLAPLGCYLELIEPPARRRAPVEVIGSDDDG